MRSMHSEPVLDEIEEELTMNRRNVTVSLNELVHKTHMPKSRVQFLYRTFKQVGGGLWSYKKRKASWKEVKGVAYFLW